MVHGKGLAAGTLSVPFCSVQSSGAGRGGSNRNSQPPARPRPPQLEQACTPGRVLASEAFARSLSPEDSPCRVSVVTKSAVTSVSGVNSYPGTGTANLSGPFELIPASPDGGEGSPALTRMSSQRRGSVGQGTSSSLALETALKVRQGGPSWGGGGGGLEALILVAGNGGHSLGAAGGQALSALKVRGGAG